MTLVDFICSVCKEVLTEERVLDTQKKKVVSKKTYTVPKSITNSKKLITESILKDMIAHNTMDMLNDNFLFTPLARDLWTEYKNKK